MSLARTFCLILLAAIGACSGILPNTAVPRHLADRYAGAITAATPIATVIHDREIHTPDLASPRPLLEQLRDELAKSDPEGRFKGITYDLTPGNMLPRGWLVQSPDRWGRKADDLPYYPLDCKECDREFLLPSCASDADCKGGRCGAIAKRKVCLGHSDALLIGIHDLIVSARRSVDLALLQPAPDTRFLGVLKHALAELAHSRRNVVVRVLVGQYPPDGTDAKGLFSQLAPSGGRLSLSVASMRTCIAFEDCESYSWNHAKIIVVDGRDALVGGHNMWSVDYLVDNPVHDLSMRVRGPAAASAARFIDRLWQHVCVNPDKQPAIQVEPGCLPAPAAPSLSGTGGVPILAVGRMGAGITKDFANQSELARDLALGAARQSIRIVQQDLGFNLGRSDTLFPESMIDVLVDFLLRQDGDIHIVLSNDGATGNSGMTYSNSVPLKAVARHLRLAMQRHIEASDPLSRYEVRRGPDRINALLCERVHLAPFRFGPDDSWPGGRPIGNHGKFWMVDDRAFYIGSDNMYPVNLQEFGYIVDDRRAAQEVLSSYWTPLWQWSQRAAVSGRGVEKCIFREVVR